MDDNINDFLSKLKKNRIQDSIFILFLGVSGIYRITKGKKKSGYFMLLVFLLQIFYSVYSNLSSISSFLGSDESTAFVSSIIISISFSVLNFVFIIISIKDFIQVQKKYNDDIREKCLEIEKNL